MTLWPKKPKKSLGASWPRIFWWFDVPLFSWLTGNSAHRHQSLFASARPCEGVYLSSLANEEHEASGVFRMNVTQEYETIPARSV